MTMTTTTPADIITAAVRASRGALLRAPRPAIARAGLPVTPEGHPSRRLAGTTAAAPEPPEALTSPRRTPHRPRPFSRALPDGTPAACASARARAPLHRSFQAASSAPAPSRPPSRWSRFSPSPKSSLNASSGRARERSTDEGRLAAATAGAASPRDSAAAPAAPAAAVAATRATLKEAAGRPSCACSRVACAAQPRATPPAAPPPFQVCPPTTPSRPWSETRS
mmetsp:Transcript_15551/g.58991  ORF Transcript_15551/g.58991 Transcript_15551/m.58991 type:complete len:224 (-) Transcript_15551:1011-1682(-)